MTEPSALEIADKIIAERFRWRDDGGRLGLFFNGTEMDMIVAALRAPPAQGEPVAWTNEAQLSFLKDPRYIETPMAMWAKPLGAERIPLYAAPFSPDLVEVLENVRAAITKLSDFRSVKNVPIELHKACQALTHMMKGSR